MQKTYKLNSMYTLVCENCIEYDGKEHFLIRLYNMLAQSDKNPFYEAAESYDFNNAKDANKKFGELKEKYEFFHDFQYQIDFDDC